MTDRQISLDVLSDLSINRLRWLVKPVIAELVDEFMRSNDGHELLSPLVETSCVNQLTVLVKPQIQEYVSSEAFLEQLRIVLLRNEAFRMPLMGLGVSNEIPQPSNLKISTINSIGTRDALKNLESETGQVGEMRSRIEDPVLDIAAWGIFAKIQLQYNRYMKDALDDSERHHIQCQAYSVVRAKCRRSAEIKCRVQRLVLRYIESIGHSNQGLDEQTIKKVKSAIYDASSKYKISLTR